jgi:hypothetical protein
VKNDAAVAAQVRHHPATTMTLFLKVASHLEWWIDKSLNFDAVD